MQKLLYTPNVSVWFNDVGAALQEQGYHQAQFESKKYFSSSKNLQDIVLVHRFSALVDQFIPSKGVVNFVASRRFPGEKDIQIAIPGSYEDLQSHLSTTCMFVYLINPRTRKCFHRNIQACSMRDLME